MTDLADPPALVEPGELPEPKASLRDYLLGVDDIFQQLVTVPGWGGIEVLVKSVSLLDRHRFIAWMQQLDDVIQADAGVSAAYRQAATLVMMVHDPVTDQPLFTYADIPHLVQRNGTVILPLIEICNRVMGMTAEATDLGKDGSSPARTSAPS